MEEQREDHRRHEKSGNKGDRKHEAGFSRQKRPDQYWGESVRNALQRKSNAVAHAANLGGIELAHPGIPYAPGSLIGKQVKQSEPERLRYPIIFFF